ncbi:rta1 domain-containing protein [Phlyctema vagabunda]|uniref:Rta1 domain-containing protein n=1 Tax=Phlyctema vagabunda TaxID=108571 RepID=A0ABR4PW90_9HELO
MPAAYPEYPACMKYDPDAYNGYGYRPSLVAGILFVILFFLSSATHAFQAFHYKTRWLSFIAVGAGIETLGWIARTGAHFCVYSGAYFSMQISLLIIAPAVTMAGIYIVLFRMIPILGQHTSPFPPKICLTICLVVDCISLVMQAVGGGLVSTASSNGTDMAPGTNIMVTGIIFQLSATVTFAILMSIVFFRGRNELAMSTPLKRLAFAMIIAVLCMVTRGVYRSIELLEGWRGYLNLTERYVLSLDAALMILAVVILNFLNPGKLLQQGRAEKDAADPQRVVSIERKGSGSGSEIV